MRRSGVHLTSEPQEKCARCGSCTVVCPVYHVTGRESLTARGKLHLLGTDLAPSPSANFQDLFAQCLLCGACEATCPRQLSIRDSVVAARMHFSRFYGQHGLQKSFVRMALARPSLLQGLIAAGTSLKKLSLLPEDSGLRLKLGLLGERKGAPVYKQAAGDLQKEAKGEGTSYFVGCLARYVQPAIGGAAAQLFEAVDGCPVNNPETQACCGLAAWSSGRKEEARSLARKNITAFQDSTGPVVASCGSCSSFLATYPTLFEDDPKWHDKAVAFSERVTEFSTFLTSQQVERHLERAESMQVYYHQPCHLRHVPPEKDGFQELIDRLGGIDQVNSVDEGGCCGQGGLFYVGYPELSDNIFAKLYSTLGASRAAVVLTTCSGCLMQWQIGLKCRKSDVQAVHLAEFLAGFLGFDS